MAHDITRFASGAIILPPLPRFFANTPPLPHLSPLHACRRYSLMLSPLRHATACYAALYSAPYGVVALR